MSPISVNDAFIDDSASAEGTFITIHLDDSEMNKFRQIANETKSDTLRNFIEQILNKAFYDKPMEKYE